MEWNKLLCSARRRMGHVSEKDTDNRTEFEKDYHRIIGSASFRRLQDKTQVFPLDQSDFVRTRLTHSLEVSSFARSLGSNIGERILREGVDAGFHKQSKEDMEHILLCAGLIHDLGNPPFGHFGEWTIRDWFKSRLPEKTFEGKAISALLGPARMADFCHFDGNAQALRLVTKLHFLVDAYGMNLTYALLNTIIKYPGSAMEINEASGRIQEKKMGYFLADKAIYEEIADACGTQGMRHPLTYILEAADDIAYLTADVEDAFVKGKVSYKVLEERLQAFEAQAGGDALRLYTLLKTLEARGRKEMADPEMYAVKNLVIRLQSYLIGEATEGFMGNYAKIMAGTFEKDLFSRPGACGVRKLLAQIARDCVFETESIYRMEATEHAILSQLMEKFVDAVLLLDTPREEEMRPLEKRLVYFISDNYKKVYYSFSEGKDPSEKLYLRLLLVTDFVCGMTDSYAKRLYQELFAMPTWKGTV